MKSTNDFRVVWQIDNFKMDRTRLDFGDFSIMKIESGPEAKKWKDILSSDHLPEHILLKDYFNFVPSEKDVSGFDDIMNDMQDLLLVFRLFQEGDLFFNNLTVVEKEGNNKFNAKYKMDDCSVFKYSFQNNSLQDFIKFRKSLMPKITHRSRYIKYFLEKYMVGLNTGFYFYVHELNRIVDHVIALESFFMFKSSHDFIARTLAGRVSRYLENPDYFDIVKKMYNERSKIVHGNYIDLDACKEDKLMNELKVLMPAFNSLMREVLIKLLRLDIGSSSELVKILKNLYVLPKNVEHIMNIARKEATTLLGSFEDEMSK